MLSLSKLASFPQEENPVPALLLLLHSLGSSRSSSLLCRSPCLSIDLTVAGPPTSPAMQVCEKHSNGLLLVTFPRQLARCRACSQRCRLCSSWMREHRLSSGHVTQGTVSLDFLLASWLLRYGLSGSSPSSFSHSSQPGTLDPSFQSTITVSSGNCYLRFTLVFV